MNENIEQEYHDAIRELSPVKRLSAPARSQFVRQAEIVIIPCGSTLFQQDEQIDDLLYLLDGEVEMRGNDEFCQQIIADNEASRAPLNRSWSCRYTALAKSRLVVLRINRFLLDRLISLDQTGLFTETDTAIDEQDQPADWKTHLLQSQLFTRLPPGNMHKMFSMLCDMTVKRGDQVVTQGMPGEYFYIIREGRCKVSRRTPDSDEQITITELEAGDCFGEEALISGERRNASVTMLTSGRLMKLAKRDFDQLMQAPDLKTVSLEQATALIEKGAVWLDVRCKEEIQQNCLVDSRNIALSDLKQVINSLAEEQNDLSENKPYILVCDTGIRSAVGAMILTEQGINACYLDGGLDLVPENYIQMSEQGSDHLPVLLKSEISTTTLPAESSDKVLSLSEQIRQVNSKVRSLKETLINENQLAKQWLCDSHGSLPVTNQEDLGMLIEARKKIDQIENKPAIRPKSSATDIETGRSELGLLREQLENAQQQLLEERERAVQDENISGVQDVSLKRVTEELEIIKTRLREQESYELQRRKGFEQRLAAERTKMHKQLSQFSLGLDPQQSEGKGLEIEKVKQIIALEMRHIIEKFKSVQAQQRQHQQMTIQNVRKQLQQQAALVIAKARQAQSDKEQAIAALREMQQQLNELRKQRADARTSNSAPDVPLLVDIESMGDQIDHAKRQLRAAESNLSVARVQGKQNKVQMEQVLNDESSFKTELIDWFASNDQFNINRDGLSEDQKLRLERIKKIAHEALEEALNGKPKLRRQGGDPDNQFFNSYK